MMRRARSAAGVFIFVISVILLVWGFKPLEHVKRSQQISPSQLQAPIIPEQRKLTLEYPAQIRAGDSDTVRLMFEVDDFSNITPTAQFGGNVATGEAVVPPSIYESQYVIAEAKFEGTQVSPSGLVSQTLWQGQPIAFYWNVHPEHVGIYNGTVWFYLRFVDKVSGEESRRAVSAQIVEIETVNALGFPADLARTAGGIGSVVGAVFGFPFFEDIVRFILKKVRHTHTTKI